MNAQTLSPSHLSALNSNATAQTYLQTLITSHSEPNSDIELAYEKVLFTAQLNYSMGSLQRVDRLLGQLKNYCQQDVADYKDNPKKHNFLLVLAFYIGEMAAKHKRSKVNWYTPEQFTVMFPDEPSLTPTLANQYVAVINQQLFKPIEFVLHAMFQDENSNLTQFLKHHLNQESCITLSPASHLQLGTQPTHTKQAQTEHTEINAYEIEPKTADNLISTSQTAMKNVLDSVQEQKPDTGSAELESAASTATPAQAKPSRSTNELATSDILAHTQPETQQTKQSEMPMVRTTQHASKLIQQFKPPVLPAALWSLPCIAIVGYTLYRALTSHTGFSTGSIITLLIFGLALIAIWVNYAMSHVGVFNNKITASSLFKNKAAIFDLNNPLETRFFHLPAAGESGLQKWLGKPASAKILTSQDTLSVSAQNHDSLEDLLLEIETELLLDTTLAKLQNSETVAFGEIHLTKDLLVYGKKGLALNRVGDYDITENDFIILDTHGQIFARIALASQPNINTLVTVIEQLQG